MEGRNVPYKGTQCSPWRDELVFTKRKVTTLPLRISIYNQYQ